MGSRITRSSGQIKKEGSKKIERQSKNLQELVSVYREGLLSDVIPFWLEYGVDPDYGGVFSSLDRDGALLDSDKSVWVQGRFAWLLGEMVWRGWQVPVISYEQLVNRGDSNTATSKARILIVKTLGESTQLNYIGLVIQGLPKLKKISTDNLIEAPDDELPDSVFSLVTIDNITAFIPELGELTLSVEEAAYNN